MLLSIFTILYSIPHLNTDTVVIPEVLCCVPSSIINKTYETCQWVITALYIDCSCQSCWLKWKDLQAYRNYSSELKTLAFWVALSRSWLTQSLWLATVFMHSTDMFVIGYRSQRKHVVCISPQWPSLSAVYELTVQTPLWVHGWNKGRLNQYNKVKFWPQDYILLEPYRGSHHGSLRICFKLILF